MAHLIDETTGIAAIAYVGKTPWHGLGQRLSAGASIEEWRHQSGLAYDVLRAPVQFDRMDLSKMFSGEGVSVPTIATVMSDRHVLYRSDTGKALSVVSKDYKVVQPGDVLDFFGQLAEIGGFEMETAGALSDGKRIWALAKVNDGAPIIGHDVVRPYVLLATSYDGTLATTAKFTAVRVVCNNTLTMSVGAYDASTGRMSASVEADTQGHPVSSMVRIPHSKTFDAESVRRDLGIVSNVWDRWLVNTRLMAQRDMSLQQADHFVATLLGSVQAPARDGRVLADIRKSKGYGRIMDLFSGATGLIGDDLTGGQTRWKMLNAVTQEVDHNRGKSEDTRMQSAWFGAGEGLKNQAYKMLMSV